MLDRPNATLPSLDAVVLDTSRPLTILGRCGVAGGAVYDGLVGLAALESDRLLITCDRRAVGTYRALGVQFELLSLR